MEEAGKKSYRVDGVGLATKVVKLSVPTLKTNEQKKEFVDWALSKSEDFLLANLSIHAATLNKLYNEEIKETGQGIPGCEIPKEKISLSFRKESV